MIKAELIPLTKEDREKIIAELSAERAVPNGWMIAALFDAEAYWRNAVKNAAVLPFIDDIDDSGGYAPCVFCSDDCNIVRLPSDYTHKSDCPWTLSQET